MRHRTLVLPALLVGALALSACGFVAGRSAPPSGARGPAGAVTEARVASVVDGDTIRVEIDGAEVPIRYIGIDAPERGDRCFDAATARNAELVRGRTVWLERDVSETDRFDRLLRSVWVQPHPGEWLFVSRELVSGGFAEARAYPPDVRHQPLLDAAEAAARRAQIGCLWSD